MNKSSRQTAGVAARLVAARTVAAVLDGRSLGSELPSALLALPTEEQALAQHMTYGTLRWAPRLQTLLGFMLDKPLRRRDRDLQALALVGLFQLIYSRVPDYAAVSASVETARALGNRPWAGGFINALLRRFERERTELLEQVDSTQEGRYSHPSWLIERLRQDWPQDWEWITTQNNLQAPMTLRVALDRISRNESLQKLRDGGFPCHPHALVPSAIVLDEPTDVGRIPGFAEGSVSVQDAGAQLAAGLLEPGRGHRVLDACAAPGGKTVHLLEQSDGQQELLALDQEIERLRRVQDNLERCRRNASLVCADLMELDSWWDRRPFQRILLDVPCSASGVIRRHPDIKSLRRPGDLTALNTRQLQLLQSAWRALAPDGLLVYATCSVFRAENEDVVTKFLETQHDAVIDAISLSLGREAGLGWQILPGEAEMDGFYYARLARQTG